MGEATEGVRVEIALDADPDDPDTWTTWEDVSEWWRDRPSLRLGAGVRDWADTADPAECRFRLDNRDGRFSMRNVEGPWFGRFGRNTPLRVTAPGVTHSAEATVSSGDPTAITGDLDLRFWLAVDPGLVAQGSSNITLFAAHGLSAPDLGWALRVAIEDDVEVVSLLWSEDGSSIAHSAAINWSVSLPTVGRVTLDVNNGDGGWTVSWWSAPEWGGPWTLIGREHTTDGTTSIHGSTADVEVFSFGQRLFRFQARDGIDGSVWADPDFTALDAGVTVFEDSVGNDWVSDAATVDRHLLFEGLVLEWPLRWDQSGRDSTVPIVAAGRLRRLSRRDRPLDSALRRAVLAHDLDLLGGYWPMEDGREATQLASPVPGVPPMRLFGDDLQPAGDDEFPGSLPGLFLPGGRDGGWRAEVRDTGLDGAWQFTIFGNVPTLPASDILFAQVMCNGSSIVRWAITLSSTEIVLRGFGDPGDEAIHDDAIPSEITDGPFQLNLTVTDDGAGVVTRSMAWFSAAGNIIGFDDTHLGEAGHPTSISTLLTAPEDGIGWAHASIVSADVGGAWLGWNDGARIGWKGEPAAHRIIRLCREERVPIAVLGPLDHSPAVGEQTEQGLLDLLHEAAAVDGGLLFDGQGPGLSYITRSALWHQVPLLDIDMGGSGGEVAAPPEPTDDDQHLVNDLKLDRTDGSSYRHRRQPSIAAVGVYDDADTVNTAEDHQLQQLAAWRTGIGTVDEPRWPAIPLRLHANPELIPTWLLAHPGVRLHVDHAVSQIPGLTIDQHILGWAQDISTAEWNVELQCVPSLPWRGVDRLDGSTPSTSLRRIDTSGAELDASLDASTLVFDVTTTAGPRFTTDAAYTPFDVLIGDAEVVTIDAVAGTGLTQEFTASARGVNGVTLSHAAGASVRLAHPLILAPGR